MTTTTRASRRAPGTTPTADELSPRWSTTPVAILDAVDGLDSTATAADAVGAVGVGRGPRRRTRRRGRDVADRPQARPGPGDLHGRPGVPAHAQVPSVYRDGYKAHVAVEPETGLITGCDADPGQHRRRPTGVALLDGEEPGWRSWPTPPTAPARSAPRSTAATPRSSSRCRCRTPTRSDSSPATTSPSTTPPAP